MITGMKKPHEMLLHKGPRCLEHKINKAINGRKDYERRFELLSKGSNVLSKEMRFYYLENKYVNLMLL